MKPSIFPDRFDLDELTQIIQMYIKSLLLQSNSTIPFHLPKTGEVIQYNGHSSKSPHPSGVDIPDTWWTYGCGYKFSRVGGYVWTNKM